MISSTFFCTMYFSAPIRKHTHKDKLLRKHSLQLLKCAIIFHTSENLSMGFPMPGTQFLRSSAQKMQTLSPASSSPHSPSNCPFIISELYHPLWYVSTILNTYFHCCCKYVSLSFWLKTNLMGVWPVFTIPSRKPNTKTMLCFECPYRLTSSNA